MSLLLQLLWLLLLCAGSAWAQLPVTESFESDGEGTRYTSTTNTNTVTVNRYFLRAKDPVTVFGTQTFGIRGTVEMTGEEGTYFWACEGVRGTSINSVSTVAAGTLTLNPINNTQNYTDLKVTVAFGDPRGDSNSNPNIVAADHVRVLYRYGTSGAYTIAGEFTRDPNAAGGAVSLWTRVGGTGTTPALNSTSFSDHTFNIQAGTGALYVQIEADYYGSNKEIAFDNIRVTGTASSVPKPTITSNVGTSALMFAEGTATPLTVFPSLAVTNPAMTSNPTLTGATVTIATGYAGAEDVLTYTIPSGSGISLSSNTGQTLTFSGTASVANYEALLESVRYRDTEANNATAGDRKLSFLVKSAVDSAPLERIITVTTALNGPTQLVLAGFAENFDTDGEGTRYGSNTRVSNMNGFARLNNASGGSATPGSGFVNGTTTTFTNVQGTGYWYTNGTQGVVAGGVGRLTLAPVNSAGFVNLHFKVRVGAISPGSGFTSNEFLRFSYSTDGGSNWTIFANYTGASGQLYLNGNTANPVLDTSLDNADFALPASLNGATISFRAETNDGGSEQIVFDDIQITGTQQTTVNAIVRASANPTNALTVNYTVTFETLVTGLTAANFSLTTTGNVSGATVGTPTAGAGYTWTVPVNTGSGSGTLTLNLANDTSLSADITTTLPFAGETYTIDKAAPTTTISSSAGGNNSTTGTTPIPFTITFSESVTGFVQGDLSVTGGTVSGFSGSGTTYTFTVTPSGSGNTVTVNVAANTAQDAANNGNTAASPFSITFQAPTITVAPVSLPNGTQGTAYSQALSASGGTAPYTYAITAGALPAGLMLASNGTLSGTPAANGSFTFTVTATDASTGPGPYTGAQGYTLTIAAPAVTAVTWTGDVSTDWYTTSNWTTNQVPNTTLDVTIPTSPTGGRFPAVTSGTATTRNLTINSGATLSHAGGTLNVNANLTNNGTFQPTGGTVVLGTAALGSILGSGNIRFWNLAVGTSGAQLSTSIGASVQRLLTLNGNFVTNGNPFTLESNASNTAMVVNNGSSVVNGNVTVQRYINSFNSGLGYRHYSSPVQNTTIADLATSSFTPVVNNNYNSATAPRRVQPYPTVYTYNQARLATSNASYAVGDFDNGFLSPSALTDPLVAGLGYSVNISSTNLVDLVGQLNNGTLLKSGLARGAQTVAGWQLLGNPYPSPIDWNQLRANSTGLENSFYVFKSSGQYTGSYAVYTNGQSTNTATSTIPSMQGFFVRVQPGGGSVNFTNSCRLTSYDNSSAFARQAADTRPTVRLELLTAQGEKDEALVYFELGATPGVDTRYDAVKLANPTRLNLGSRVGSDFLVINGLPNLSTSPLTVPLSVQVPSTGRYTLLASQLANLAGNRVVLHDRQTGTLTDLTDPAGYVVELTEGQHDDRFDLLFNPATEPTLGKKGQLVPAKRH